MTPLPLTLSDSLTVGDLLVLRSVGASNRYDCVLVTQSQSPLEYELIQSRLSKTGQMISDANVTTVDTIAKLFEGALRNAIQKSDPKHLLSVTFDDCDFTNEEKALCMELVTALHQRAGGIGLKIIENHSLYPSEILAEV